MGAFFVGVGVAFVFVKIEISVGTWVDAEFYGAGGILVGVLDLGA